jgi:hypothetical protein
MLNFSAPVFGFSAGGWAMLFAPFVVQGLMLLLVPGSARTGKAAPSAGVWFLTGLLVLVSWVLTAPVSLVVPSALAGVSLLCYH